MSKIKPLEIGTIAKVYDQTPDVYLGRITDFGLSLCQLGGVADNLLFGPERASRIAALKNEIKARDITVSAVWVPYRGQKGSFSEAPTTLGLVPESTRAERMIRNCMTSQLAAELDVNLLAAHVGFIPEDNGGDRYKCFVEDMHRFLEYCQNQGQSFIFETGQEGVDVLERFLKDLDMPNIGLNFDMANLLIYNFDAPSALVDRLGKYIINTHIKDGKRPTRPASFGEEVFVGEGDANVFDLIKRLYREYDYTGPLVIEREIEGEQQKIDIQKIAAMLENVRKELGL